MKQLTKSQRHEAYIKATHGYDEQGEYKRFIFSVFPTCLCFAIDLSLSYNSKDWGDCKKIQELPEMKLFKPELTTDPQEAWWGFSPEEHESRYLALSFMIAMTE